MPAIQLTPPTTLVTDMHRKKCGRGRHRIKLKQQEEPSLQILQNPVSPLLRSSGTPQNNRDNNNGVSMNCVFGVFFDK
jgi:hypothetical protein